MYKPVVVTLERDAHTTFDEQLCRIMSPFLPEPDKLGASHCDGWVIGGHWSGHFLSRHGDCRDLVHPLRFPPDSPLSGYVACDGGPKGLLDLARLQCTAEEQVWRRWPARYAERSGFRRFGKHGSAHPSREDARLALDGNRAPLAQARGQAVIKEGLVTLEGEWIDPDRAQSQREAAFERADAYIDALDDNVWLICLAVHF